jgi:hypothetical protein
LILPSVPQLSAAVLVSPLEDHAPDWAHGDSFRHLDNWIRDPEVRAVGRGHRDALVAQFGRLDPLIPGIIHDEMRNDWWRHLVVSIPLAWCGLWASWLSSLILVAPRARDAAALLALPGGFPLSPTGRNLPRSSAFINLAGWSFSMPTKTAPTWSFAANTDFYYNSRAMDKEIGHGWKAHEIDRAPRPGSGHNRYSSARAVPHPA